MSPEILVEQLFEALTSGDRPGARQLVQQQLDIGVEPDMLITDLFWPAYEMVDRLYRADQITSMGYNLSTRLLRVLIDQAAPAIITNGLEQTSNRTVFACCGDDEGSELGAQMAVDLLEAGGMSVRFAGGGIPIDEIQETVQRDQPDALLSFCSNPADLPSIRKLIDKLHEIGACPSTQIVVGGGVFNRADGLAEEIGADLWASDPLELVDLMIEDAGQRAQPDQRTVGRNRRVSKAA